MDPQPAPREAPRRRARADPPHPPPAELAPQALPEAEPQAPQAPPQAWWNKYMDAGDDEDLLFPRHVRPNFRRDDPLAALLFLVVTVMYYTSQYVNMPGVEALATVGNILFLLAMPHKIIKFGHAAVDK